MPAPIPPRSVGDTVDDGGWEPLRVTMRLDEPLVTDLARPQYADGPLAWCAYLEWVEAVGWRPPPVRRDGPSPLDFDLGLATWTCEPTRAPSDGRALGAEGRAWGHACSALVPVPALRTAVHLRRMPATTAMARYTTDRRLHAGAGPYKARNDIRPAAWVGDLVWWVLGDRARVSTLLTRLRHAGQLGRHGYGRVQRIEVAVDPAARTRWRDRPMPGDGPVGSIRAPHWHPTRQMPCRAA